jgi:hypothetical protein
VRSGRGELLAHDGQSVNVFRLGGSVSIRPHVEVGTGSRIQAAHAPSPVSQSASLNSSFGQSQQFQAANPAEVRGAEQAPRSSLIIIGRKDHSVVQTGQNTPSAAPSGSEPPSFAASRQGNVEAAAFSQDQQRPAHSQNPTLSQTPRNPGSPFSGQRQVRTETSGSAAQTPAQGQGRTYSIPQEVSAPPPRQFSAPHYDPPPRPVERVEVPQRAPEPVVVESRAVRSEPAPPPPSAPAAPPQPSSHR